MLTRSDLREIAIGLNPERGIADVTCRDKRWNAFLRRWAGPNSASLVATKSSRTSTSRRVLNLLAFQLGHGLLQKLAIKIESDRHDVAALRRSQDAAGAADLEIAHRDAEARA